MIPFWNWCEEYLLQVKRKCTGLLFNYTCSVRLCVIVCFEMVGLRAELLLNYVTCFETDILYTGDRAPVPMRLVDTMTRI